MGKQDRVYYLHDKTRPHAAKLTREKLLKLGRITVPYPPYSRDLASKDYHLFCSLFNYLLEKKSQDEEDMKIDLINFLGQKFKDFYEDRILSLPE